MRPAGQGLDHTELDTLLARVDTMDTSINKFNERLSEVEKKIENFGYDLTKLKEEKTATARELNDLTINVHNLIEDLEKRLKNCQKQFLESRNENRKESLRNEMYSKRLNILIHGLEENTSSACKTKETTEKMVYNFLNEALGIDNPKTIKFADVHRLSQHPVYRAGKKMNRPVIIKLTNSFDKHLIFKSLKNLKLYNDNRNLKPKSRHYTYITEYLPRELQLQKKRLLCTRKRGKKEKRQLGNLWAMSINFTLMA